MLQKLIVLAALIAIAWYGFKLFGRLDAQRKGAVARKREESGPHVAETVKCRECGAYIAEDAKSDCGKPGCPFA